MDRLSAKKLHLMKQLKSTGDPVKKSSGVRGGAPSVIELLRKGMRCAVQI